MDVREMDYAAGVVSVDVWILFPEELVTIGFHYTVNTINQDDHSHCSL